MRNLSLISLACATALLSCAIASAQVYNGNFAPLTNPSYDVGWGTNSGLIPSYSEFGLDATLDWDLGYQYAYGPAFSDFDWTFNAGAGQQNGSDWGFTPAPNVAGQSAFIQDFNGTYYSNVGFVPVGADASLSSISQSLAGLSVGDSYVLSFYMGVFHQHLGKVIQR